MSGGGTNGAGARERASDRPAGAADRRDGAGGTDAPGRSSEATDRDAGASGTQTDRSPAVADPGGGAPDAGPGEGPGTAIGAKWNARYAYSGVAAPPPAEVLSRHARYLPVASAPAAAGAVAPAVPATPAAAAGLTALDLACGLAGNGEWLAARGYRVTAWDVSARAIEAIRRRPGSAIARAEFRDVVAEPPPPDAFDVIVVARFLERAICPAIAAALRPGGVLFYQTFTAGLSNPDYLLAPGELPRLFPTLEVLAHREGAPDADGRAEAMLVARRRSAPKPP